MLSVWPIMRSAAQMLAWVVVITGLPVSRSMRSIASIVCQFVHESTIASASEWFDFEREIVCRVGAKPADDEIVDERESLHVEHFDAARFEKRFRDAVHFLVVGRAQHDALRAEMLRSPGPARLTSSWLCVRSRFELLR